MRDSAETQRELEGPVYGRHLLGHQRGELRRQRLLVDGRDGVEVGDARSRQAVLLAEGYLRRNPNDSPDPDFRGWDFWLNKLNQFNGDYFNAEMVKAFISSTEYQHRFGQ